MFSALFTLTSRISKSPRSQGLFYSFISLFTVYSRTTCLSTYLQIPWRCNLHAANAIALGWPPAFLSPSQPRTLHLGKLLILVEVVVVAGVKVAGGALVAPAHGFVGVVTSAVGAVGDYAVVSHVLLVVGVDVVVAGAGDWVVLFRG